MTRIRSVGFSGPMTRIVGMVSKFTLTRNPRLDYMLVMTRIHVLDYNKALARITHLDYSPWLARTSIVGFSRRETDFSTKTEPCSKSYKLRAGLKQQTADGSTYLLLKRRAPAETARNIKVVGSGKCP